MQPMASEHHTLLIAWIIVPCCESNLINVLNGKIHKVLDSEVSVAQIIYVNALLTLLRKSTVIQRFLNLIIKLKKKTQTLKPLLFCCLHSCGGKLAKFRWHLMETQPKIALSIKKFDPSSKKHFCRPDYLQIQHLHARAVLQ